MNRKLALAASTAASVVLVSGAAMLSTVLSRSPADRPLPELVAAPVEGDTTSTAVDPVVVVVDQYELVPTGSASGPATTPGAGSAAPGVPPGSAPTDAAAPRPTAAAPTPAVPPTTRATAPATTSTTRPPGVPEDWPADKPIPPMPAGCREPQLEDDGVWNCQH